MTLFLCVKLIFNFSTFYSHTGFRKYAVLSHPYGKNLLIFIHVYFNFVPFPPPKDVKSAEEVVMKSKFIMSNLVMINFE